MRLGVMEKLESRLGKILTDGFFFVWLMLDSL